MLCDKRSYYERKCCNEIFDGVVCSKRTYQSTFQQAAQHTSLISAALCGSCHSLPTPSTPSVHLLTLPRAFLRALLLGPSSQAPELGTHLEQLKHGGVHRRTPGLTGVRRQGWCSWIL